MKPAHALAYAPLVNLLSKVPSFRYHHPVHSPLPLRTPFGNVLSTHIACSARAVSHDLDGFLQDEASSLLHLETGKGLLRFAIFLSRPRRKHASAPIPRPGTTRSSPQQDTLQRIPLARSRTPSQANARRHRPFTEELCSLVITGPPALRRAPPAKTATLNTPRLDDCLASNVSS